MARRKIDLHGCRAEDVSGLVDHFICEAVDAQLKDVRIITGKGKGIVQSEVIKYLKMGKYPWKYERMPNGKENTGVLVIFLE